MFRPNLIRISTQHFQNKIHIRTLFNKISPHPKNSLLWYKDFLIVMGVFGTTGTSSVYITRPLIQNTLGLEGSLKEGPWSYRLTYIAIGLPTYSLMLLGFGTLAGRAAYFRPVVMRMWSRFLPKSVVAKILK